MSKYQPAKYDHMRICELYQSGKSISQICQEIGCTSGAVIPALRKYGIKTRSISDAVHLASLGDKSKQTRGYIFVDIGKYSRILEHRKIMAELIGRPLTSREVVHHKDGNTSNNAIENLELMNRDEHTRLHYKLRRAQ